MPGRTQYDELHDSYQGFLGNKPGTRYERLAALVFKALEERHVVIHDFALSGRAEFPHQIDVLIDSEGKKRRTIIECKEFDSEKKVGLGVARDFLGLVLDTRPDRAIIVTTIGFTPKAKKLAETYGIETAILRAFSEGEVLREVVINLGVLARKRDVAFRFSTEEAHSRYLAIMASEDATQGVSPETSLYLQRGAERIQVFDFIEQTYARYATTLQRERERMIDVTGWTLYGGAGQIPLEQLLLITHTSVDIVTTATDIADLLLETSGQRAVIRDRDLRRTIDPDTREVR